MDEVAAKRAARFLMWGSVALLSIAPFAWIGLYFWAPIWLALSLHLAGWGFLWRAIREEDPRIDRGTRAVLSGAFLGSVLGFVVGLATLPVAVPGGTWWLPVWVMILVTGWFAFVPSVYGPVVASHAFLFLAGARMVRVRRAKGLIVSGSGVLLALAAIGIFLQVATAGTPEFFRIVPVVAAFTSAGYAAIAHGWRLAARARGREDSRSRIEPVGGACG